jgi:hypothetical protein
MARASLKDLKAKLKKEKEATKKTSGGGFWYPLWDLPHEGKTSIRILEDPNEDNDLYYYLQYLEHNIEIDGKWERIPCPKTWGQHNECPICELSAKMYAAKKPEIGKYYYRNLYTIVRGLITKDGLVYEDESDDATGTVRPFKFSYQLSQKLKNDADQFIEESDEDDAPFYDLDAGIDFVIKKIVTSDGKKEFPKYDIGSGFALKPKKIPDALQKKIGELEPLAALLPPQPTYDEVHAKLEAHQNVVGSDEDDDDDVASDEDIEAMINRQRNTVDDDDDDNEVESLTEDDDDVDVSALLDDDDDDDDGLDALAKLAAED